MAVAVAVTVAVAVVVAAIAAAAAAAAVVVVVVVVVVGGSSGYPLCLINSYFSSFFWFQTLCFNSIFRSYDIWHGRLAAAVDV